MTAASHTMGNQAAPSQSTVADREIVITRTISAPRELVWQAWTDPTHLIHWWGPQGFTNTFEQIDVRPGGVWRFIMHGPDGVDYPNEIIYQELEKPARLVVLHGSGAANDPDQFQTILTLEEEQDGKTRLTMRSIFPTAAARAQAIKEHGAVEGGNQTIDRLVDLLANAADRELVITRVFDAPRSLVWQAWTDPVHIAQWWGPQGFGARVPAMDLRPGGHWRYIMIGPDGAEYASQGVIREVVPLERLVTTDEFGEDIDLPGVDLPGGMVVTALFEDVGDKTRLTLRTMHRSAEDRRKHEAMGVKEGWASSFECLDEHLATMTAK